MKHKTEDPAGQPPDTAAVPAISRGDKVARFSLVTRIVNGCDEVAAMEPDDEGAWVRHADLPMQCGACQAWGVEPTMQEGKCTTCGRDQRDIGVTPS